MTVEELIQRGYTATAYCTNPDCETVRLGGLYPYGTPLDLAMLDPKAQRDDVAARLKCRHCKAPGKLVTKARAFNRGADAGFASMSTMPRDMINFPTPPDRPDTPEMTWHGKHRSRRRRR